MRAAAFDWVTIVVWQSNQLGICGNGADSIVFHGRCQNATQSRFSLTAPAIPIRGQEAGP
jgi:hypothetical protein